LGAGAARTGELKCTENSSSSKAMAGASAAERIANDILMIASLQSPVLRIG
jgi:hypothetical protein